MKHHAKTIRLLLPMWMRAKQFRVSQEQHATESEWYVPLQTLEISTKSTEASTMIQIQPRVYAWLMQMNNARMTWSQKKIEAEHDRYLETTM